MTPTEEYNRDVAELLCRTADNTLELIKACQLNLIVNILCPEEVARTRHLLEKIMATFPEGYLKNVAKAKAEKTED